MSSRKVTPVAKSAAIKPFCKVCQDAGKTEKEYTSHFVRSKPGADGVVVCPTLLNQSCTYCFEAGHTAGYCPVIAANKKAEEKAKKEALRIEAIQKREIEKKAPKVSEKKIVNRFAALDDSSSDSETEPKKVTKNKPKMNNNTIKLSAVAPAPTQAAFATRTMSVAAVVPAAAKKCLQKKTNFQHCQRYRNP